MKKITSYVFLISGLLTAIACNNNQGIKQTKSGLLYKIISDGKGELVKKGQFLKFNYSAKLRDSILYSTADALPFYALVDSSPANYNIPEVFGMLRKGDSVIVIQLADSIEARSGRPLPPYIKKKDKITTQVKVLDIFPNQELAMVDKEKEMTSEKARESKAVEAYIAEHKIIAQKTAAGTFVEIKSVGDGPGVDSGKLVSVLYTGKYFPSGKVFETNTSGAHTEPIKFVIGQQRGIIQGWDDGLRLFKKGGKGSLYIPAFLAYGQQAGGPSHKPFENLIFDVEIVGVENAPPPPPANATKLPAFTLPKQNPAAGNKK